MSNKYMELARKKALETSQNNIGGPFGCCIVKDGNVICVASNSVIRDNDPTAHGEINAIREAGKILGTYDLSGCELFTSSYPCPMCLSAIIWANIKKVYYGCTVKDAEQIGFRDDFIYNYLQNGGDIIDLEEVDRAECLKVFEKYLFENKTIY